MEQIELCKRQKTFKEKKVKTKREKQMAKTNSCPI